MKRIYLPFAIALSFLLCSIAVGQSDAVKQAANNICKISFQSGGGIIHSGSGIYIKTPTDHYVLTCQHLIDDNARGGRGVVMFPYSGETINGNVVGISNVWDQMLIKLDKKPNLHGAPIRLYTEAGGVKPSERVWIGGYASGQRLVFHSGTLTNRRGQPGDAPNNVYDWQTVNAGVWSGMSGGPVIDEQGFVVGNLWGGDPTSCTFNSCKRNCVFLRALFPRLAKLNDIVRDANRDRFGNCGPNGCAPNNGGGYAGGGLRIPFPGAGTGGGSTTPNKKPDDVVVNQDLKQVQSQLSELKKQIADLQKQQKPSIDLKPIENRLTELENKEPQFADLGPIESRMNKIERTQKQIAADLVDVKRTTDNLVDASKGLLDEVRTLRRDIEPDVLASRLPGIDVKHNGKDLGTVKLGEQLRFNFIEKKLTGGK